MMHFIHKYFFYEIIYYELKNKQKNAFSTQNCWRSLYSFKIFVMAAKYFRNEMKAWDRLFIAKVVSFRRWSHSRANWNSDNTELSSFGIPNTPTAQWEKKNRMPLSNTPLRYILKYYLNSAKNWKTIPVCVSKYKEQQKHPSEQELWVEAIYFSAFRRVQSCCKRLEAILK